MHFDVAFVTKVFAALFAIMNPFADLPVFLSLTDGAAAGVQRRVAIITTVATTIGCVISVVAGRWVLSVFGISVEDFKLAGGILVLLIALTMVQGDASHAHSATPKEHEETRRLDPADVAIYPLTVPLLVGPGTIATLIVFGETAQVEHKFLELGVGLFAFLCLLGATMLSAPFIGRHVSQTATAITRRLMGMILAAIAMEMVVSSLRALFPVLGR